MGLFSMSCRRCKAPVGGPYYLKPQTSWMNRVVALAPDGSILARGPYDGYGRCNDAAGLVDIYDHDGVNEWYHEACFDILGACKKRGTSPRDRSQGGFTKALPMREPPCRASS